MIKIGKLEVYGWFAALRGMRNPMNSWDKSDTTFDDDGVLTIGDNDHNLAMSLARSGGPHAKYRRMIGVSVDIIAPLYWWKEFDTYKVGTVANSCSTMHKIHDKEFTLDDFSHDHLIDYDLYACPEVYINMSSNYSQLLLCGKQMLDCVIMALNFHREQYLKTHDKRYWWQMIQLLPSSYNQLRTVTLNYEVLAHIYNDRKDHKLDEWKEFCKWIETLPYSELITLREEETND